MFQVYVTNPNPFADAFGKEAIRNDLDSAIRYAFMRIAEIRKDSKVWIECLETGESIAILN